MTKGRIVGLIILALIIVIQLVPTERPDVIKVNKNDLLTQNQFNDSVSHLIKTTCYDCHSNETKYPWYAYVAPVSWLVNKDIRVGREHLNFSDWETLSKMDKAKLLGNISDEIEAGNMPMPIYVLMHPEARLSIENRELLIKWTEDFGESLFE